MTELLKRVMEGASKEDQERAQKTIKNVLKNIGEGEKCLTCESTQCPMYPLAQLLPKTEDKKEPETVAILTAAEVVRLQALETKVKEHERLVEQLDNLTDYIETERESMWEAFTENHGIKGELSLNTDKMTIERQQ